MTALLDLLCFKASLAISPENDRKSYAYWVFSHLQLEPQHICLLPEKRPALSPDKSREKVGVEPTMRFTK